MQIFITALLPATVSRFVSAQITHFTSSCGENLPDWRFLAGSSNQYTWLNSGNNAVSQGKKITANHSVSRELAGGAAPDNFMLQPVNPALKTSAGMAVIRPFIIHDLANNKNILANATTITFAQRHRTNP